MKALHRVAAAMRRWSRGDRSEAELSDEVRSYLQLLIDDYRAAGMDEAEAGRRARIDLGGVAQVEEQIRESRAGAWFDQTASDIRYACRGLRRTPVFALTAISMLALAISVTVAVFAVINAAQLQPLAYQQPHQLVEIGHLMREPDGSSRDFGGLTWAEVRFWRAQTELFSGVEAKDLTFAAQLWSEGGATLQIGRFTAGLPTLLGVRPLIGRTFTPEEAEAQAPVLLINEEMWSQRFGRRADALGATMTLGRTPYTVIGVMPSEFRYGAPGSGYADVWSGLPERGLSRRPEADLTMATARLRDGLSLSAAKVMAAALTPTLQTQVAPPSFDSVSWTVSLSSLPDDRAHEARLLMMPFLLMLAAAAIVLLVACASVANLFAARTGARSAEFQVRAALGASRARILRLVTTDAVLVSAAAAMCGIAGAKVALTTAVSLMPASLASQLFRVGPPVIYWRVVVFGVALAMIAALCAGVLPALRHLRAAPSAGVASRIAGDAPRRGRIMLQAFQVALALALAVGALALARSVAAIFSTDLGFDARRLVWLGAQLPEAEGQTPADLEALSSAVLAAVQRTPNVQAAAIGGAPVVFASGGSSVEAEGQSILREVDLAFHAAVGPGYFAATGIRLLDGREFTPADLAPAMRNVIIDERSARRFFNGHRAVGRRFRTSPVAPFLTVVGVVANSVVTDFSTTPTRYGVYQAWRPSRYVSVTANAASDAAATADAMRRAVEAVHPGIVISTSEPVSRLFEKRGTFAAPRFIAALVSTVAGIALLIAAAGLHGLVADGINRRSREFSVRMALGSNAQQIAWLVVTDALRPVLLGIAAGWCAAALLMRYIAPFLYAVSGYHAPTFAACSAALVLAAMAAIALPLRRAVLTDPIQALKAE